MKGSSGPSCFLGAVHEANRQGAAAERINIRLPLVTAGLNVSVPPE
jgi:hypothetical protein